MSQCRRKPCDLLVRAGTLGLGALQDADHLSEGEWFIPVYVAHLFGLLSVGKASLAEHQLQINVRRCCNLPGLMIVC